MAPRQPEPFNARPARFPTAPPSHPPLRVDSSTLNDQEWDQYRKPYRTAIAAAQGYGVRHRYHTAYNVSGSWY